MRAAERNDATSFPLSSVLIAQIADEFPHFAIVPKKESRLQVAIHWALVFLTLGAQRQYLATYHTVLGDTLFVPESWPRTSDVARTILLRHERVHLRQRRRLGTFWFVFLYLVPILPMGLAYGRARLEWEAYRETVKATVELCGLEYARSAPFRKEMVRRFTGGDYGWMWPFPKTISRWLDEAVAQAAEAP